MTKRLFFLFFLVPVLFSCNKGTDSSNQFIINGVHDISLASPSNVLALAVSQSAGTQQPVTLTVTGLPANVTATFSVASGTPDFGTTVTFSSTGSVTPGTYPIKIVGTSSSYTKSYDLNLNVAKVNGFTVDNVPYNANFVGRYTDSVSFTNFSILSNDNGGGEVDISYSGVWPTADGTYTYSFNGSHALSVEFMSTSTGGDYHNGGLQNFSIVVKITGGKASVSATGITLYSTTGTVNSKSLNISASE